MPDDTTLPPPEHSTAGGGDAGAMPTLFVAWYPDEPERVGEALRARSLGIEYIIGRAPWSDETYGEFAPHGLRGPVTPRVLGGPGTSRRLLSAKPVAIGWDVKLLKEGAPMYIDGQRSTEGVVSFGQTVYVEGCLLLYAALRAPPSPLRYFPTERLGPFGRMHPIEMVGEARAFYAMLDGLAALARSNGPALLTGETGVGKEAAAKLLWALSNRARAPYERYNAAALPKEFAATELFGNRANYPNPGMPERLGIVRQAGNGTVCLDEIGEIPMDVQAALLRLLESSEVQPTGGMVQRVDVRLLAATNRPLDSPVFRRDFVPRFRDKFRLPSLAERPEDIPLIAREIAEREVAKDPGAVERFTEVRPDGSRFVRIGGDLVDALLARDHPENVRGLESIIRESIRYSTQQGYHRLRAWPELLRGGRRDPRVRRDSGPPRAPGRMQDIPPEVLEVLRYHLDGSHGSVSRAAKATGMSRQQVNRAIDKYGLLRPSASRDDEDDEGGSQEG